MRMTGMGGGKRDPRTHGRAAEARRLGKLLGLVAADLDNRLYASAGVVRRSASVLLRVAAELEALGPDRCSVCGAVLEQPPRGRRRTYCSVACRRAAAAEKRSRSG